MSMGYRYIVVGVADAQLARVMFGRLYAQRHGVPYPIPGTLYVWDPQPNALGTQVAFGPIDLFEGEEDFGDWCMGRSLVTDLGTLTLPSAAQVLEPSWFPIPIEM
jgi:hypothetical protein